MMGGSNGFALLSLTSPPVQKLVRVKPSGKRDETHTGGWRDEVGRDRHPIPFRLRESWNSPPIEPDELVMGGSRTRRRIAMGLDDRMVLRKPQPSHLVGDGPRERSLVSLIPFLDLSSPEDPENYNADQLLAPVAI